MADLSGARSALSIIFLLHIAIDGPVAIQGIWAPASLPLLEMTNTTLVALKLYAALSLATCLASVLVFPLPEFLPGKRAFALCLLVYHSTVSTVLLQAPRIIPHSFGSLAESLNITPEKVWGSLHGILSVGFAVWWQLTLGYGKMVKKSQ